MSLKPLLFVVLGPTAVGKTALAIEVAQKLNTDIISADSRQVFAEMNIGTAKPNVLQLATVKHHFIGNHSIHEDYNAGIFETEVLKLLSNIFQTKPFAVMVGGTGLYIDAVCNGFDELPKSNPLIRKTLQEEYEQKGLAYLQQELQNLDPVYFQEVDINNPQRLMRAIEVCRLSEMPYSTFRQKKKIERPFEVVKIGLELPREELYERINQRLDIMMNDGLLDEAKKLYPFKYLNALQTVGYREMFDYFDGSTTLEKAVELIKQNTRRYAKRQLTWFRRYIDVTWFSPDDIFGILDFIENS